MNPVLQLAAHERFKRLIFPFRDAWPLVHGCKNEALIAECSAILRDCGDYAEDFRISEEFNDRIYSALERVWPIVESIFTSDRLKSRVRSALKSGKNPFKDSAYQEILRDSAATHQDDNWCPGERGYAQASQLVWVEMEFPLNRIRVGNPDEPFSWREWFLNEQAMADKGAYQEMLDKDFLEPIVLFDDGDHGYIWDGYHRVGASVTNGRSFIKAIVGVRPECIEAESLAPVDRPRG